MVQLHQNHLGTIRVRFLAQFRHTRLRVTSSDLLDLLVRLVTLVDMVAKPLILQLLPKILPQQISQVQLLNDLEISQVDQDHLLVMVHQVAVLLDRATDRVGKKV